LTCFYGGPVWKAHRDTANATMIDSDDVLLLRLGEGSAFPASAALSRYFITVYSFDAPVDEEWIARVRSEVPALTLLQTEPAENNYPRLPVRAGEHVIVALTAEDRYAEVPGCRVRHMRVEATTGSRLG